MCGCTAVIPRMRSGHTEKTAVRGRLRQHDYLYSDAERETWAKRVEHIQRFAERTFVVFNNDAGGKSFVNALQLRAEMTGVRGSAPRDLRRKYPVELAPFDPAYAEQQCLFPAASAA